MGSGVAVTSRYSFWVNVGVSANRESFWFVLNVSVTISDTLEVPGKESRYSSLLFLRTILEYLLILSLKESLNSYLKFESFSNFSISFLFSSSDNSASKLFINSQLNSLFHSLRYFTTHLLTHVATRFHIFLISSFSSSLCMLYFWLFSLIFYHQLLEWLPWFLEGFFHNIDFID